jgi:hypothetical protein
MNEWMTNIIGKFFSLISNILDAKREKIIWDNQNSFPSFCLLLSLNVSDISKKNPSC